MKSIDELQAVHPHYKDHANQSDYLFRSYIGGSTYRKGQFLTKYIGEENQPGDAYYKRLQATPLDNHVQTTVDIYRSFLFREAPTRELGLLLSNPLVQQWVHDTDQEGQGMDSFLKTVNDFAMVMGNVWILVDKPSYAVETQAEEIAMSIRAYAAMYTPQNVLDWYYKRNIAGKMILEYIKVKESENSETVTISCWHTDMVEKYTATKDELGNLDEIIDYQVYENPLGYVPFVNHVPMRSPVKGIGYSIMADVADAQRFIYNMKSEIEQTVRISSHPTLVKTPSADATAGAGGIVTMDENTDPGLKPYLLQNNGSTVDSILATIEQMEGAIMHSTHTSAVQGVKQAMSGVALQTERQLLNAKLSDLSDTLMETEKLMWKIWFDWQGMTAPDEFAVTYNDSFDIRDRAFELELLIKARSAGYSDAKYFDALNRQLATLMIDDPELLSEVLNTIETTEFEPHFMYHPDTGEEVQALTEADHERLAAEGYVHR